VIAVGCEQAWLVATADKRATTVGTARRVGGLGLPVRGLTRKRQIGEHAGAQAIPTLIQCLLDFR